MLNNSEASDRRSVMNRYMKQHNYYTYILTNYRRIRIGLF